MRPTSCMRDAHGVVTRLRPAVFRLERTRSAVYLPRTKGFPKNTEMEVTLTFVAEGSTAGAGGGFEKGSPRRRGAVGRRGHGAAAPLAGRAARTRLQAAPVRPARRLRRLLATTTTRRRSASRSRSGSSASTGCEKKDPSAKVSDAVKPIVYYVDRGAPEPIRSALLEGASAGGTRRSRRPAIATPSRSS